MCIQLSLASFPEKFPRGDFLIRQPFSSEMRVGTTKMRQSFSNFTFFAIMKRKGMSQVTHDDTEKNAFQYFFTFHSQTTYNATLAYLEAYIYIRIDDFPNVCPSLRKLTKDGFKLFCSKIGGKNIFTFFYVIFTLNAKHQSFMLRKSILAIRATWALLFLCCLP